MLPTRNTDIHQRKVSVAVHKAAIDRFTVAIYVEMITVCTNSIRLENSKNLAQRTPARTQTQCMLKKITEEKDNDANKDTQPHKCKSKHKRGSSPTKTNERKAVSVDSM